LLTDEHIEGLRKKEINWNDLISKGLIEYLDAEEENNTLIATTLDELTEKHTHMEVDPLALVGTAAALIPFFNHNLTGRNLQASKQMKQTLGLYASNYNMRSDTQGLLLNYPQKQLVYTTQGELLETEKRPDGLNAIIALVPYYGYNTQDALILNKGSLDRGCFRGTLFQTYKTDEKIYSGGQKDRFEIPGPDTMRLRSEDDYTKLGEDGIVAPETWVDENEVIVGGTAPPKFLEEISEFGIIEEKRREKSMENKKGIRGWIDSVILSESEGGTKAVKLKVRMPLFPEPGDKFSSMHFQKGVVGTIINEEDMPFTRDGVKPDVIINPAAIPSRMIMAQVFELLLGKTGALEAIRFNGTGFNKIPTDKIREGLMKNGFRSDGKEALYNGISGEKIDSEIMIGCGYYRRLKYLAATKLQARGKGRVQMLTRQPTEGKARQGGLKFEEMQRDCLIGYGAAMLLQDRLLYNADLSIEHVCETCGVLARADTQRGRNFCPVCKGSNVVPLKMPYAFKLALDELMSLHIYPKLVVKDKI
ncbi:MAG: DNA-directed RNA polymerase subunit B, partial [Candidatus Diapherotrites archaeon]|nr:DNA-directed RNA polymerase subunit B [Candidatus Diapherotrites archaeon]